MVKHIMLENHPNDSRVKIDLSGVCQSLTGRMGTGGGNVPLVLEITAEGEDEAHMLFDRFPELKGDEFQ